MTGPSATGGAVVLVQARTGSTRLPGKVLAEVAGRPLLGFMLARLQPLAARGLPVVVATSDRSADDPVADVAAEAGAGVVRGPEDDVLARMLLGVDRVPAPAVVRLTADCPLADPGLVADVVAEHRRTGADYTSNTLVRTFPDGLDVEVVAVDALRAAAAEATDPAEREHVTPFVVRRPRRFHLAQVTTPDLLGLERWTVDTADDLAAVRAIVDSLADPIGATWRQVLAHVGRRHRAPAGAVEPRPVLGMAHTPGTPYVRRWDLLVDGAVAGTARVAVDDGRGSLDLDVPASLAAPAEAAVRAALAADQQVRDLVVSPPGAGPTSLPHSPGAP